MATLIYKVLNIYNFFGTIKKITWKSIGYMFVEGTPIRVCH